MRLPSVMSHNFSRVPQAVIPRSAFNRTHGHKTTFNAGYLVPVFFDEVLPGDTFNLRMTAFSRLATPLHPFMDNMYMETFFFFVPKRLVWNNWPKFNGEQTDPGDSTDFVIPEMTSPAGGYVNGSLSDYFGLPTAPSLGANTITHMSLFHRAYNLIWNEWFRDQNLQDSVPVPKGDGPDSPADFVLLRRGKRHDYFTSSLPWPQKGPAVDLPLGTSAPVIGIGNVPATVQTGPSSPVHESTQQTRVYDYFRTTNSDGMTVDMSSDGWPEIFADLTAATAATINQLRQAFQVQKLYERDARGGTRYTEIIRSHFGVISPDARLQRPEYLGGGSSPVNVSPVVQQSESATTPQGNLAGIGTSTLRNHGFMKSFTEHGIVIGLVCVRADLNYQQGLDRMFSRSTRFDFYWPALAHIGEQAVLNKEIMAQGTAADDQVFGYQERWAEMRYKRSLITGQMRSNYAQSLDTWHLAQDFGTLPVLNSEFIVENPPVERVIAVPTEPHFIFDSFFQYRCARPMPTYSVPGLIDHF